MAPTAFEKGKTYGHYGLKEAVRWVAARDMVKWTQGQLEKRWQEVLERVDIRRLPSDKDRYSVLLLSDRKHGELTQFFFSYCYK